MAWNLVAAMVCPTSPPGRTPFPPIHSIHSFAEAQADDAAALLCRDQIRLPVIRRKLQEAGIKVRG